MPVARINNAGLWSIKPSSKHKATYSITDHAVQLGNLLSSDNDLHRLRIHSYLVGVPHILQMSDINDSGLVSWGGESIYKPYNPKQDVLIDKASSLLVSHVSYEYIVVPRSNCCQLLTSTNELLLNHKEQQDNDYIGSSYWCRIFKTSEYEVKQNAPTLGLSNGNVIMQNHSLTVKVPQSYSLQFAYNKNFFSMFDHQLRFEIS